MKLESNKLIFNKYKIRKLIYQSKLSAVYEGKNIKNNEPVAIKFEKRRRNDFLVSESFFLFNLKGFGIPNIISFGKNNSYNILVEELLGLAINYLWDFKKQNNIKIKNVCMIALQALDRLEYIHSKNVIHKDIKPSNFLIGRKNKEIIYLIDFGFASKYRSSRTGKHIKYKKRKLRCGTLVFNSLNSNKGYEQSRKDDLESLGYMLIYLALKNLPWLDAAKNKTIDKNDKYKLISKMKSSTTPEKLCNGLPQEFVFFIKYCRNLEFEQSPNYDYLKSLFINVLTRNFQKNDLVFFWINKKDITTKESELETNNPSKRKINPKKNLFDKIKKSFEKNKNNKLNNCDDNGLFLEHRDTIKISGLDYKGNKNNNNNNKNINKSPDPRFKVLNNINNKNNLIKLNTKDKDDNREIYKDKKIKYRNFINNRTDEGNIQISIDQKKNYNILFCKDINCRNINYININNTISSSKKKNLISDNNIIHNLTNHSLKNIFKEKNNSNKLRKINHFSTDFFNLNVSHTNYRTLKERESMNSKNTIPSNAQKLSKIDKIINSNNRNIFIKKKIEFPLYNTKNTNYHNIFNNKNIICNNISMGNSISCSLPFKKNLKNMVDIGISNI